MAKIAKKSTGKKTIASKAVSAPSKKASGKTIPAKVSKKVAKTKSSAGAKPRVEKKAAPKKKPAVKASKAKAKSIPTKPVAIAAKKVSKAKVKRNEPKSQAQLLAEAAIHGILEKKGRNVICMDLKNVPNAVCDFFIICEADSTRQVSAIADSVDFEVKKATGENPFHTEGWENSLWILLDYVNVVVHVFEAETRHFYRLESLWADAEVKEYGIEYA
jgi:ribosome-associated protein